MFIQINISVLLFTYIFFSKQVTIYIDVANSGARIYLLYVFVSKTSHLGITTIKINIVIA